MSSALFTAVTTTLKGENYDTWASEMEAFLQATGLESAITADRPSEPSPLVVANTASVEAWKNYDVAFKTWKEIDQKGQNGNDDNKKKRKHGSGKNKKAKKNTNAAQADADSMVFGPIGSTVDFGPVCTDLTPSIQDVRKHSIYPPYNPPPNTTSLRLHKKTRMAMKRACDIGVRATAEVIRALEPSGHISELDDSNDKHGSTDPPAKRNCVMLSEDDIENGNKAPMPPLLSPPMDFEVPGTASFDPDELMNFDLDREILAITGFMDTMGCSNKDMQVGF
ncbi:hypothetical protein F5876DRAFT_83041 [Lentinula aff. lateritia]|uniref:Uncharacterized protein n=1 Tax=Lentinula aff. lateritia TaxID=2804960 RepID=A0ACC1TIF0_9AGAR|nr:hypothetical protein F5876DRAFT_83041 [Lentinula aff. lateritia]